MTGTKTQPAFGELLAALEQDTSDRLATAYDLEDSPAGLQRIADSTNEIAVMVQEVGRAAQRRIESEATGNETAYYVVYEWLDEARDVLILLRNIIFERHRGQVLVNEGQLPAETLLDFDQASKEEAEAAMKHLIDQLRTTGSRPIALRKKIKKWELENTPLAVHMNQIAVLIAQVEEIGRQAALLEQTSIGFARIREHFESAFSNYLDYLKALTESLHTCLNPVSDEEKEVNPTDLIKQLRSYSIRVPDPATVAVFIDQLNLLTNKLPGETDLIVGTEQGLLQQNSLNISKETSAWLQSELMSEVQDFYNRREQMNNRLLMAIRTGENRLEFDREEGQSSDSAEISRTVEQLVKNIRRSIEGLEALERKTLGILKEEVSVEHAFTPDFLQLNLQQTLSQYRKYQQSGLTELRDWAVDKWRHLVNKGRDSFQSEGLSPSERIVRLIKARKADPAIAHYTGMFINSGYLGESFRVGRERELERTRQIIDNWNQGFRGAILITGSRHSGKTFFGEMIGHQFFQNRYIDLRPNVSITIAGRILEPTEDLEEALKFVVANSRREQRMVLIDDLSGWQDRESPLAADVQGLLQNLDQYADRLFFVVCADTLLYDQLKIHFEIDKYFQATFPMRRFTPQQIEEAIFIRHGATQMQVVDEMGNEFDAEELGRLIKPFTFKADGHIGEGLRQWAYAVRPNNDDSVLIERREEYDLDVSLSKDAGILLRAILVARVTSEYQLRKQFGPIFNDEFKLLIQRYLQLGILIRRPNGLLEIQPTIVSDVEVELARSGFIPPKDGQQLEEI